MLEYIQTVAAQIGDHINDIFLRGVTMVSAIIVAIGLLKPLIFDKIPNKHVRKVALALTNVAACWATVLVYFVVCGYGFDYYVLASTALSVSCIITYWLYENTCLRNLIGLIGGMVLKKLLGFFSFAASDNDKEAIKAELIKTGEEIKAHTSATVKKTTDKIKEDKDLTGL